jgi:hypothetical protein
MTDEIAAAFDKGYEHARTLPPKRRKTAEEWLASQDPRRVPAPVVLLTVGDMTGVPKQRPESAGRHLARGHWMKRLFLRGRS